MRLEAARDTSYCCYHKLNVVSPGLTATCSARLVSQPLVVVRQDLTEPSPDRVLGGFVATIAAELDHHATGNLPDTIQLTELAHEAADLLGRQHARAEGGEEDVQVRCERLRADRAASDAGAVVDAGLVLHRRVLGMLDLLRQDISISPERGMQQHRKTYGELENGVGPLFARREVAVEARVAGAVHLESDENLPEDLIAGVAAWKAMSWSVTGVA